MSDDMDDWKPMSDDFRSISFNSYRCGQTGAHLPYNLLPAFNSRFGSQASEPNRTVHTNVRLFVEGFPSELTESGLKTYLKRIGCKLLSVKIVKSKSQLDRHFSFVSFETTKDAQKAIELIRNQKTYKLFVSFASTERDREKRELLIDNESQEFERLLREQTIMRQKIDLGNNSVINSNSNNGSLSPIGSENSNESNVLDVLSPLSKSDKLLKVLQRPDDDCSFCVQSQAVEHLHFVLSENQVVDPYLLPALIEVNTSCLSCGVKTADPKMCSQCKTALYCGPKCQSNHWRRHKVNCRPDLANESSIHLNSSTFANTSANSLSGKQTESKRKVEENSMNTNGKPTKSTIDVHSQPKPIPNKTPLVESVSPMPKESTPLGSASSSEQSSDSSEEPTVPKPPEVQQKKALSPSRAVKNPEVNRVIHTSGVTTEIEYEELVDGERGVSLCYGRNPFDFYLQKASSYEQMDVFANEINKKKNDFPQMPDKDLVVGALCGGIYSVDDTCYRAQVVKKVGEQTYALKFVDYGNTEPVEAKHIRALPRLFFACKAQGIHCKLHDIEPKAGKWDSEAINLFGQLGETNDYSKVKIFGKTEDGICLVDLFNSSGQSIRHVFVNKKLATIPSDPSTAISPVTAKTTSVSTPTPVAPKIAISPISAPVPPKEVKTPASSPKKSNDSPVIVPGSPKVVFNRSSIHEMSRSYSKRMAETDVGTETEVKSALDLLDQNRDISLMIDSAFDVEEFQYFATVIDSSIEDIMKNLAEDYPIGSPIKPRVDDIVVVKASDDDFYRAFVIEVNESKAKVFVIDSAFVEEIDFKNVYKMSDKYLKYPAFGVLLVPEDKDAAILLELTATKEVGLLEGIVVKTDDKTYVESNKHLMRALDFRSAAEFMQSKSTNANNGNHEVNIETSDEEYVDCYYNTLPLRRIELNKAVEALVLYQEPTDPTVFFVAGDDVELKDIMEKSSEYSLKFSDNIRVNPMLGDVYLVRSSDQEWYRAVINGKTEEKCDVMFIDFGNKEEIDSRYIMELPSAMKATGIAPIAVKCKVESTKLSPADLKEKIEKASDGTYLLKIEPKRIDDGLHFVKVY